MPRRRVVAKREIINDPKYNSETVSRFINVVMQSGKKAIAEKIVYGALQKAAAELSKKVHLEDDGGDGEGGESGGKFRKELHIFERVIENVKPSVEVRSRRVGGATYQIPVEVRPARSQALSMRWLIQCARTRGEHGMESRLAAEFIEAYQKRGAAVKKREDTHRMADANKAFAHFRWN